jgi:hypothetical protein
MPTATVNYHVHRDERQAFHIDADGVKGRIIWPELAAASVSVNDVRDLDRPLTLAADSIEFRQVPTSVEDFENGTDWQADYNRELTALLTDKVDAQEVVVFDHTVRIDDPKSKRPPARNVHSDYSSSGAHQRLRDLLGEDKAREWSQGHYGFINIWRPVEQPINRTPLGFVRTQSTAEDDWLLLDLIYPDRTGQILGLVENRSHEWIYQSLMTPDDVAVFNIYDNKGLPSIAHSALDMVEDASVDSIRKSVESRTLVRYA